MTCNNTAQREIALGATPDYPPTRNLRCPQRYPCGPTEVKQLFTKAESGQSEQFTIGGRSISTR